MNGFSDSAPARRASRLSSPAQIGQLARFIAEERGKIGELTIADLSSQDVIRRIEKLEQMINQYTRITYVSRDLPK